MYWQIPLILSIFFGYITQPFLNKKVAHLPSRARNLIWQFFFSATVAITAALFVGTDFNDERLFIVAIVGSFNALGCYCYWRAIESSLSKTSLFTQADDLTALTLGYIILHEANFLNPLLGLGIIVCLSSVFIFVYNKWRSQKNQTGKGIAKWIAVYSIIWGVDMFLMRYFAVAGMSPLSYLSVRYGASFCSSLLIFTFSSKEEKGKPLRWKQIFWVLPLSINIWITLMFVYWVRILAPITVSQPIWQVSEIVLPTLIGLWIFKEVKELQNIEKLAMLIGLTGGLIIIFSY